MTNDTKIIITAQTNQAEGALRSLGSSVDGITRKMFDFSGIAGTLAGALSVTAFAGWIRGAIDAADQLNDLAQKTGISIEALAGYKLAAEQSGTSLESVARGVKGLSVYMVDHADTLKKLGITSTDTSGAMLQLADVFKKLPDGAEKTKLAVEVLGKAGMDMIPMLNLGSQGLGDLQEKAAEYGRRMKELAPDADKFNDQLAELSLQADVASISLGSLIVGPMAQWLEAQNASIRIAGGVTAALRLFVFNLDAMTTEKPVEEINRLTKALQDYQSASGFGKFMQSPTGFLFGGREDDLKKQLTYLEYLKKQQERVAQPAKITPTRTAEQAAAEILQQREFAAKVRAILGDGKVKIGRTAAVNDPDAEARRFILSLQKETDQMGMNTEATKLFEAAKLAAAHPKFAEAIFKEANAYHDKTALLYESTEATKKLADAEKSRVSALDEAQRLIISIDPQAKANAEWQKLLDLQSKAVDENGVQVLSLEQIGQAYAGMQDKGKEAMDQMSVFAEQAGRNIQNAFADFLFDPFKGGVSGMLQSFKTMMQRMAAEAAAAQILGSIGNWGKSNSGDGGLVGTIASIAGMMFPAKAIGGPVSFGTTYLVGERGPELFTPGANGNITPNNQLAGSGATFNIYVPGNNQNPEAVRRAAGQGAREALAAFNQAGRYA